MSSPHTTVRLRKILMLGYPPGTFRSRLSGPSVHEQRSRALRRRWRWRSRPVAYCMHASIQQVVWPRSSQQISVPDPIGPHHRGGGTGGSVHRGPRRPPCDRQLARSSGCAAKPGHPAHDLAVQRRGGRQCRSGLEEPDQRVGNRIFRVGGAMASLLSGGEIVEYVRIPYLWLAMTAAVTFTTVQSQDLPDMKGDAARNRLTMPLRYGELPTRISIAFFALFWSLVCPAYFHVSELIVWCLPLSIGIAMAFLVTRWDESSDKIVWTLWCLWVAVIYLLPLLKG